MNSQFARFRARRAEKRLERRYDAIRNVLDEPAACYTQWGAAMSALKQPEDALARTAVVAAALGAPLDVVVDAYESFHAPGTSPASRVQTPKVLAAVAEKLVHDAQFTLGEAARDCATATSDARCKVAALVDRDFAPADEAANLTEEQRLEARTSDAVTSLVARRDRVAATVDAIDGPLRRALLVSGVDHKANTLRSRLTAHRKESWGKPQDAVIGWRKYSPYDPDEFAIPIAIELPRTLRKALQALVTDIDDVRQQIAALDELIDQVAACSTSGTRDAALTALIDLHDDITARAYGRKVIVELDQRRTG